MIFTRQYKPYVDSIYLLNQINNSPKIIIPEKEAVRIRCQRCQYEWPYSGKNNFVARCPHCRTTVTIKKSLLQSGSKVTNSRQIATAVTNQPSKEEHNYG